MDFYLPVLSVSCELVIVYTEGQLMLVFSFRKNLNVSVIMRGVSWGCDSHLSVSQADAGGPGFHQ